MERSEIKAECQGQEAKEGKENTDFGDQSSTKMEVSFIRQDVMENLERKENDFDKLPTEKGVEANMSSFKPFYDAPTHVKKGSNKNSKAKLGEQIKEMIGVTNIDCIADENLTSSVGSIARQAKSLDQFLDH